MTTLRLVSPLAGRLLALEAVPDPVFAQGLAGDGVAIEPLGEALHAPCDGEIVMLARSGHALTLRHAGGAEILLHLGIDTVALQGAGFLPQVRPGQYVRAGEVLLQFDLDRVAAAARSAITPVLLAAGGRVLRRAAAGSIAVGDFLFELTLDAVPASGPATPAPAMLARYRVPFEHGLHARPAAQLVAGLRGLDCAVELQAQGRRANARSTVALMSLGLRAGDAVLAEARGPDAAQALAALAALLTAVVEAPIALAPAPERRATPIPARLRGQVAVAGLALGVALPLHAPEPELQDRGAGPSIEREALRAALAAVASHLEQVQAATRGAAAELIGAHRELLEDPDLHALAQAALDGGAGAGRAWSDAVAAIGARLEATGDTRLAERRADLRDLRQQVLLALRGEPLGRATELPPDAVLLVDELLPSQLLALSGAAPVGICMARGGATSHVALLAAARGIPTLVGAGDDVLAVAPGTPLLFDAERGEVVLRPAPAEVDALRQRLEQRRAREASELAAAAAAASTRDGTAVAVHANLGDEGEAAVALARGADGCGLLRSEFLYLDRRYAPDEDEQARSYGGILQAFGARPVVLRTLDVGGDKPLAYLPLPREENPALGVRGVRLARHAPAILRTQLRAALRAAAASGSGGLRLMLPMVNDPDELREVRGWLREEASALGVPPPPLGAMVETPAAALQADALLREADFLSIGSNDLAQYTLAIDRGHAQLGARLDAVHPAVLRLVGEVCAAGRRAGKRVSLCGGLASDREALPLLLGLGLRELSVVPAALPRIKRGVREADLAACEALAQRALRCGSAEEVRALLAMHADTITCEPGASAPAGEGACAG